MQASFYILPTLILIVGKVAQRCQFKEDYFLKNVRRLQFTHEIKLQIKVSKYANEPAPPDYLIVSERLTEEKGRKVSELPPR